jgi:hypothetical protein
MGLMIHRKDCALDPGLAGGFPFALALVVGKPLSGQARSLRNRINSANAACVFAATRRVIEAVVDFAEIGCAAAIPVTLRNKSWRTADAPRWPHRSGRCRKDLGESDVKCSEITESILRSCITDHPDT